METNKDKNITEFLKELRESSDRIHAIFTKGSCYRLTSILKAIYPEAEPYWSDLENHAITKIDDVYYDIGGPLSSKYVEEKGYYLVPERLRTGYYLIKYKDKKKLSCYISPEKYRDEHNKEDIKT